jgi:hypothetical protein
MHSFQSNGLVLCVYNFQCLYSWKPCFEISWFPGNNLSVTTCLPIRFLETAHISHYTANFFSYSFRRPLSFVPVPFQPSRPPSLSISHFLILQWLSPTIFRSAFENHRLGRSFEDVSASRVITRPAYKQHSLWTVCDESTAWMETLGHRRAKVSEKRRQSSTSLHGYESGMLVCLLRPRIAPSSPVHYETQLLTSGNPTLLQIFSIFMLIFIYYLSTFEYRVHMFLRAFALITSCT